MLHRNQISRIDILRGNYNALAKQKEVGKISSNGLRQLNEELESAQRTYGDDRFNYRQTVSAIIRKHTALQRRIWDRSQSRYGGYHLPAEEQRNMITSTRRAP